MGIFGSGKTGYWKHEAHMFKADEFICSECGSGFGKMSSQCPRCKARMKKTKYDPKWIDELEAYDALFED